MEPNAALQEPPVEPSVLTVLSSVWQSCGGEMYNCEHSRCDAEQRDGCRDVDVIVLNVRRNAINRNLSRFFFFSPLSKTLHCRQPFLHNTQSNTQQHRQRNGTTSTCTDIQACARTDAKQRIKHGYSQTVRSNIGLLYPLQPFMFSSK